MACDVQTVLNLVVGDVLPALSDRDALICLAGVYGSEVGLTAQQALDLAGSNGYHKLSDRELWETYLKTLC